MYIRGELDVNSSLYFKAAPKNGVILCIQLVKNTSDMKFNSVSCNEINYYQEITEIRFIQTENAFKHTYSKGSVIKRVDIFFPSCSLAMLSSQILCQLNRDGQLSLEFDPLHPFSRKARNMGRA
jgi:hypothetical protein